MPALPANAAHRPDIDGLRGIAVALVVLYHAKVAALPGGYVGVDMFLVLSGYLVTQMLLPQMDGGGIRYRAFLARRVRRLLPAAVAMIAATLLASLFILAPQDLSSMAASSLAALASVANLYFWGRHGYFASQLPEQPLLHTWSLGLEEQFYLAYPLGLMLLARCRGRTRLALAVALFALLAIAPVIGTGRHPGAAFYLLPTRAWEFLLGGLVAMWPAPGSDRRWLRELATGAGLAAIAAAATGLSRETPYPGAAAFLPAFGTALLIRCGARGACSAGAPLRWRWLGAVGLLSYSLYLWHWPILALVRYGLARDLAMAETLAALALLIGLSWLSWRHIEQPYRHGGRDAPPPQPLAPVLALAATVALGATLVWWSDGLPQRLRPADLALDPPRTVLDDGAMRCHHGPPEVVDMSQLCTLSKGGAGAPGVLLWGDSHANAIAPALASVGTQRGFTVWQASYSSCPPLLGSRVGHMAAPAGCTRFNDAVVQAARTLGVRRVVLAAYWSIYLPDEAESALGRWLDPYDAPGDLRAGNDAENRRNFQRGLQATVTALREMGVQVWIVKQIPAQNQFVPTMLVRAARRGQDLGAIGLDLAAYRRSQAKVESVFAGFGDAVSTVDPATALCPGGTCRVFDGTRPLYLDAHHLSAAGAERIVGPLRAAFD